MKFNIEEFHISEQEYISEIKNNLLKYSNLLLEDYQNLSDIRKIYFKKSIEFVCDFIEDVRKLNTYEDWQTLIQKTPSSIKIWNKPHKLNEQATEGIIAYLTYWAYRACDNLLWVKHNMHSISGISGRNGRIAFYYYDEDGYIQHKNSDFYIRINQFKHGFYAYGADKDFALEYCEPV